MAGMDPGFRRGGELHFERSLLRHAGRAQGFNRASLDCRFATLGMRSEANGVSRNNVPGFCRFTPASSPHPERGATSAARRKQSRDAPFC